METSSFLMFNKLNLLMKVKMKKLVLFTLKVYKIKEKEEEVIEKTMEEEGKTDNRFMVDDNKAQKLSFNEIDQMKKEGYFRERISKTKSSLRSWRSADY